MNESRYRLVRPLAMGGMAELFLGIARGAEGFEKPVAIKRLLPHLAREPSVAKMFLNEARLSTHLQHQNIASVYDVGTSAEGLYLVMELVNGWDLGVLMRHARQRGARFPPPLVAFIGTQVLAGLVHAYRRQHEGRPVLTAHRDLSPSNVLISREGEVKVADFGIARVEGVSNGTEPGTFKGKMPYSSPETLQGEPATALSDQFSLGIVLYELLAGRHPFARDSMEPLALAFAISQQAPAPLPDDVPAPLRAAVMRALAHADHDRFSRPEEMAEALARYIAQSGEPTHSQALAAFISRLAPPPTLLDQDTPTVQHDERTRTSDRPSLSVPSVEPSFELRPAEEWLEVSPTAVRTAIPPPPTPSAFKGEYETTFDWSTQPDGSAFPPQPELELQQRSSPSQDDSHSTRETSALRGRLGLALGAGLLLLLGSGAVWLAVPGVRPLLSRMNRTVDPGPQQVFTLSISSEPSGATVFVDGTEVGTTPLFVDNLYPAQDIPVRLTLKGYKPWKGSFKGGETATLQVRLKR
ncbi:serine/threonine protein kinase [Melittangium boletus]|uniref:non-specific serine/threonine protein kinase n=1 Tax=Melittangium boletus DSM 14713 TaxID=1294270 RepID=A0A250I786_9BACT|nr:serine/threonine-protein kinase [Melittangium boletus]ATB27739.1 hypothetical protein MEBOL_001184 [Melittangium boletus DSM 14713]